MTRRSLTPLLVVLTLFAGCGGDDDSGGTTASPGPTSSETAETPSGASTGTLSFEQVENFTLRHLEGEAAVKEECKELMWVKDAAQKKELAPFTGTKSVEVLTCDDVPYLAYIEYADAAAAEAGLAPALVPYLIAGDTTVAMPLVGLDETVASGYLEALRAECACGKITRPEG